MSIEILAALIGAAVTLLATACGLLGWILIKLNTISTIVAVVERRLFDGDNRMNDLEARMRIQERKNHNHKENFI